ncbi:MAG: hypothetical protein AB8B91_23160 [Rubripirellula sp.]
MIFLNPKGTVPMSLAAQNRTKYQSRSSRIRFACLAFIAMTALVQCGCLGLASNLMHGLGVDMEPAEYKGLKDSKVAVVTVTDSSQYSDDVGARELSRAVGEIITRKVRGTSLVREEAIDEWRDVNGWDEIDFLKIGKGVEADKVIGIELTDLTLHEGETLFRGRGNVLLRVYDVESGSVEYKRTLAEFEYPTLAGQSVSETTESRFRRLYLSMLGQEIARSFHPYDLTDRIARDSIIASH